MYIQNLVKIDNFPSRLVLICTKIVSFTCCRTVIIDMSLKRVLCNVFLDHPNIFLQKEKADEK